MPVVPELIRSALVQYAERPAIIDAATDTTYSYAEFGRLVRAVCGELGPRLDLGDRGAVCARNGVLWAAAEAAIACCGLTLVPLNIYLSGGELAALLRDSGARAVVFDEGQLPGMEAARAAAPECPLWLMMPGDSAAPGWASSLPAIAEMLADESPAVLPFEARPDTVHRLLYTSATTGRAKGVPVENQVFVGMVLSALAHPLRAMADGDVLLVTTPLSHVAYGFFWPFFFSGNTVVLMPRYDPPPFCALVVRHRVTHVISAPTLLSDLVVYLEGNFEARSVLTRGLLKAVWYAGSPIPVSLAERAERVLGPILNQQYGLTEAVAGYPASGVTALTAEWHSRKPGSCGRPYPGVVLRVVDELGQEVPAGVEGEVVILMQSGKGRYWSLPDDADNNYVDGWLHSGDTGYLDDEGFLFLRDRRTDMIVSGGLNIYPTEVENILLQHEAVASCAVVAVADDRWIEVPHAVVVPRPGMTVEPAELISFTRDRISHFKAPKAVHLVSHLPVGPTGKILRREVRAWLGGKP